jgi:hypothetical protein
LRPSDHPLERGIVGLAFHIDDARVGAGSLIVETGDHRHTGRRLIHRRLALERLLADQRHRVFRIERGEIDAGVRNFWMCFTDDIPPQAVILSMREVRTICESMYSSPPFQ